MTQAEIWRPRYSYGPLGGYDIVFTPDPDNPPLRTPSKPSRPVGKLWRATRVGARHRCEELNAFPWPEAAYDQLRGPSVISPRRRRA